MTLEKWVLGSRFQFLPGPGLGNPRSPVQLEEERPAMELGRAASTVGTGLPRRSRGRPGVTRSAHCFLPALLLFWSRPQFALKEESEGKRWTSLGRASSRDDEMESFTKGGDGVPGAYC